MSKSAGQIAISEGMKRLWRKRKQSNKYRAKAVVTDEGRFASQKEYKRWCELKLLQKAKKISNLKRQVRFKINAPNGDWICDYIADATYDDYDDQSVMWVPLVVEDAKGIETEVFKLKRRLMKALLGIDVVTV